MATDIIHIFIRPLFKQRKIKVLFLRDNETKDFKAVATKSRDEDNIKVVIKSFIPAGNNIISDRLSSYD